MRLTKYITTAVAMLALAVTTSCLGNKENELKVNGQLPHFFNCVIPHSDPDQDLLYSGISYQMTYNYSNNTATVTIVGLTMPNGEKYPSLIFDNVPFTHNAAGWKVVDLTNYTPEGAGGFAMAPEFRNFKFNILDRQVGVGTVQYYVPLTDIAYAFSDCTMYSFPEQLIEFPAITVVDENGGEYKPGASTDPTVYTITFDPVKRTCSIAINGAKFADRMPALNMKFADIPFIVSRDGNIHMSKDSLVPLLKTGSTETPSPNYPITNLVASYKPNSGLSINFTCTPSTGNGVAMGRFEVHGQSEYPTGKPTTQQ